MAVSVITQSGAALVAYGSQGQADDAQAVSLTGGQRRDASARTSLSPVGRVRSSLDELQARAQALKSFSKPPTLDDFRTVVQGFVQSFNALNKTFHEVNSRKPGVLDAESGPGRALGEIRKAISGTEEGRGASSLRGQGIDRLKEGVLAINQNTFGKAFQTDRQGVLNAYSEVADRVGKAIDKQLSNSGFIGIRSQDLSARGHGAEVSRTISQPKLDTQKSFQQHLAAHLANAGGYVARNAVATYFSVASM